MLSKFLSFIGLWIDTVAIGLLGGWYIKGEYDGVVTYAVQKLKRCNTRKCDDFSTKYIIGYALLSARQLKSTEKENEILEYMMKFKLTEKDCIDMVAV